MNSALEETTRLARLLRKEQGALADFLLALATFDRERRWLELGHSSLFYFLHREVGLAKVLTGENRHEVLPRFFHCSKREAMAEAAAILPAQAAPHREVVTAVRVAMGAAR